jgi:ABC-type multidrug transport system fused ATPase/permease subunit
MLFGFIRDKKAVQELKVFGAFNFIIKRRTEIAQNLHDDSFKIDLKNLNIGLASDAMPEFLYYASYFYYALKVLAEAMTFGDFTYITGNIGVFRSNLSSICYFIKDQFDRMKPVNMLRTFLELEEEREGEGHSAPLTFTALSLRNVSYSYPNSDAVVLSDINLDIKKGEKVALVGYNGSGKTTLSKLILGLLDGYKGEYILNETDAKKLSNKAIYGTFSAAMQDYQKYPFTLRENITIGGADKKEGGTTYGQAVKAGDLDDVISHLPNADDTYLNKEYDENGTDLSEGQWHRLILARTAYCDRDAVIFDEPTSSLDPIAEYRFIRGMLEQLKDKTVILISHRLSNVVDFDKIIVLKEGHIIERGSHAELLSNPNTEYAKMFQTQASRYVEE